MNENEIRGEFEKRGLIYQRLGTNVVNALEVFLNDEQISFLSVSFRLKTFSSFWDKISRKGYSNPFSQIEDICGIRIIVYFPSDVKLVENIIAKEFKVVESEDKATSLNSDQFGYRSDHYIIQLKDEWLNAPNWRELGALRAEIQVRTVLMHSWADLSHKLAYKTEAATPKQFMRQLYQLSALFELADEKFEDLRNKKSNLINEIISNSEARGFDVSQELNVDTLQAYLNYRFPDRKPGETTDNMDLLEEMENARVSLQELDRLFKKAEPKLDKMESICIPKDASFSQWAQLGMVRMILDHFHSGYAKNRRINADEAKAVKKLFI